MKSLAAAIVFVTAAILAGARDQTATRAMDVVVLSASGEPVAGLSASDFQIAVDGQPALVTRTSMAPREINVILIVDETISQPLRRTEVHNAVQQSWFPALLAGDRVRVGMLGTPVRFTPWLTNDRASANAAYLMLDRPVSEPSPLWDATEAAIHELSGSPGARLVILLTDGRANGNTTGLEDVARLAVAEDVAISSVSEAGENVLPQAGGPTTRFRSDDSLRWLAEQTGGLFLPDGIARRSLRPNPDPFAYVREISQTPNRPGDLLARIVNVWRQRHQISFGASADGRVHTLMVQSRLAGLTVLARRSFVATAPVR